MKKCPFAGTLSLVLLCRDSTVELQAKAALRAT